MNDEPAKKEARIRDRWSVSLATLSTTAGRVCVLMPFAGAVAALVLSVLFAPQICPGKDAESFAPFFSTAATLIGALLIALALEAGWLRASEMNVRRRIVGGTAIYVACGAVAAVLALMPQLSSSWYRALFTLTMAGGAGALLSVLAIAYHVAGSQLDLLRQHSSEGGGG